MLRSEIERLRDIKTFPSLVKYLRDDLGWPIETEDIEELFFEFEPEELGIDSKIAAKIDYIKQFRPLTSNQPWGIFFVKFEPKRLPVVALRRILSKLVIKKRADIKKADQPSWHLHDLLFISNYGEGDQRQITFAQFTGNGGTKDLPTLKVLGWDKDDTNLHIDHAHKTLKENLSWRLEFENDTEMWREKWASAFVLRHREVITTSKRLAEELAELAQRICQRAKQALAIETEQGPLKRLHKAFQSALIHDLKEDDFADMYAQTIAYGLLAARVENPQAITSDSIADMVPITNPFLKDMMGTFLTIGGKKKRIDFDELGTQDVVDLLNSPKTHMEKILLDFGKQKMQEDPVIHFYESFLAVYDKKRKVKRGVFYTPLPVVSYIVRSVHELLKTEFGLDDGLASTVTWGEMVHKNKDIQTPDGVSKDESFVQILDPATGTATFLVEVIDVIYNTMYEKWQKEGHLALEFPKLWNEYVPKHLLPRLYGFELMMAPYAIAHMKIGLKLKETGYNFRSSERANIYLTNSLEPANDLAEQPVFEEMTPALAHEAKAVNIAKRNKRFTIVIGNPPYAVNSANKNSPIDALLDVYKQELDDERNLKPLNDDYVKFLRASQILINQTGSGVIGMITNHSYTTARLFRAMRRSFLSDFSNVYFIDLHGESSRDPNMRSDQNVFDIQQGVGISLYAHVGSKQLEDQTIRIFDVIAQRELKYRWLLENSISTTKWMEIRPMAELWSFISINQDIEKEYKLFESLTAIFVNGNVGYQTHRDSFVIDFDRKNLVDRMKNFRSIESDEKKLAEKFGIRSTSDWSMIVVHDRMQRERAIEKRIIPTLYRPFDFRFIAYIDYLIDRDRLDIMRNMYMTNIGLLVSKVFDEHEFTSVFVTNLIVESKAADRTRGSYLFPLFLDRSDGGQLTTEKKSQVALNFRQEFLVKLVNKIGVKNNDSNSSLDIFRYLYAILHSQSYRNRYAEFLKTDFPRLPLIDRLNLYVALSKLGKELVSMHLMESPTLDKYITRFIGNDNPEVETVTWLNETVWIDKKKSKGFQGIPERVWNFHIGGYQVCQKWLKGRKGRVLSDDDINHYQRIVVAINETIRIMAEIDKVIDAHGGWPDAFLTEKDKKNDLITHPELKVADQKPANKAKKTSSAKQPPFPKKNDWKTWQALSHWAKNGSMNDYWIDFASTISNKIKKGSRLSAKDKEDMTKCWKQAVKGGFEA